ncbi:MAG: hypothetical protein LBQ81_09925 [Zoogloeaceae bacterium]|jgi:hypothetical protein|nr:hypothetical protein [Zoogloeaceae bacterium]
MSATPKLIIGDLEIPTLGRVDQLSQRYDPLGGQSIFRAITGRGINQETWKKTRVTTSGSGWSPPNELWRLDTSEPLILKCVAPMTLFLPAGANAVTLPQKRRTDAPPFAIARWQHQELALPVSVADDIATVDLSGIPDAEVRVSYYPEFEVWAFRPTQSADLNGAIFGWELVCEEV